jgi:hypothetical protein
MLEAIGCVVNVTEVVAIEVQDRPGGLADVLEAIDRLNINVEYMYAFADRSQASRAVLVFRFDNPDAAIAGLTGAGVNVVGSVDLFARLEA